ncbi:MAG: DNA ligase D [Desulfobulbaceae bacterium]|nr:DNA ligase D [Desulfobulbaceae bacterium]
MVAMDPEVDRDPGDGEMPVPAELEGARKKEMPESFKPQLARLVKTVPGGQEWLHEIKLDGYRMLAFVRRDSVKLVTRNGKDWTERFAAIAGTIKDLNLLPPALLDGEIAVLRKDGSSSFQALQNAIKSGSGEPVYFVFDVPYCGGYDLTGVPLLARKEFLSRLLDTRTGRIIRYNDHQVGKGERFRQEVCHAGLEGIMCKRADSSYRQTRSGSWLKVKCVKSQEFVIGGFTEPGGTRTGFGALVLGYYDQDGKLRYCGRVGTGFTEQSLRELMEKLSGLERKEPAFADPPAGTEAKGVHWVVPRLVAEIVFTEWTEDGRLRHPSFQGLREDKEAKEVGREEPVQDAAGATKTRSREVDEPVRAGGVVLSNPDRILYPEQGITKLALAEYYEKIGNHILPHLAGRPLMIARCPQGREKKCFYQKHVYDSLPDAVGAVSIREKKKEQLYIVIRDLAGLISLVQMGALEFHPWGCRANQVEKPDRMIFDLDPGDGVPWKQVVEAALQMRSLLEDDLELRCFVRTTGGKGLHVVVPLTASSGWDEMKEFSRKVARVLVDRYPEKYVATMSKNKRKGKIFIDFFRNSRGATAICSYSTRARPGAPVAVPVHWDEISDLKSADAYSVENLPRRLEALKHDPWSGFFEHRQSLSKMRRKKLEQVVTD